MFGLEQHLDEVQQRMIEFALQLEPANVINIFDLLNKQKHKKKMNKISLVISILQYTCNLY